MLIKSFCCAIMFITHDRFNEFRSRFYEKTNNIGLFNSTLTFELKAIEDFWIFTSCSNAISYHPNKSF